MYSKTQHYFFFGLLLGVIALTALIFLPYVTALVLAVVFSTLFRPLHKWVAKVVAKGRQSSSFATIITLVIIAVAIITPLFFLAGQVIVEIENVYIYLTDEGERSKIILMLNDLSESIAGRFFGLAPSYDFESFNVTVYLQNALVWAFANVDTIFQSFAKIAINVFILLFALYYMLRDGGALKRNLIVFSPLIDSYDEQIFTKLEQAIYSVVRGSLAVGLIQGILTGLGFWITGVPNPVLWGSLAVISALIPGVGTSLVLIPGVIYLFMSGATVWAIGLAIWGVLAVGLIDNFLGPSIINRGVNIHQFLILLSVIGGITFFGPVGFILGPMVLALLFALLDIYKDSLKQNETEI